MAQDVCQTRIVEDTQHPTSRFEDTHLDLKMGVDVVETHTSTPKQRNKKWREPIAIHHATEILVIAQRMNHGIKKVGVSLLITTAATSAPTRTFDELSQMHRPVLQHCSDHVLVSYTAPLGGLVHDLHQARAEPEAHVLL